MREFDEIDMEILKLLNEDARRSFSSIAKKVGLSGPAVSDRVKTLQEAGIINRFTIDIDRSKLQSDVSILVKVNIDTDTDKIEKHKNQIKDTDKIEHIFITAEGNIWFYAHIQKKDIYKWIQELFADTKNIDYKVTLIDNFEWAPSLKGTELKVTCVECNNTVDIEGESLKIDDQLYYFCCPSCKSQFEERYNRIKSDI